MSRARCSSRRVWLRPDQRRARPGPRRRGRRRSRACCRAARRHAGGATGSSRSRNRAAKRPASSSTSAWVQTRSPKRSAGRAAIVGVGAVAPEERGGVGGRQLGLARRRRQRPPARRRPAGATTCVRAPADDARSLTTASGYSPHPAVASGAMDGGPSPSAPGPDLRARPGPRTTGDPVGRGTAARSTPASPAGRGAVVDAARAPRRGGALEDLVDRLAGRLRRRGRPARAGVVCWQLPNGAGAARPLPRLLAARARSPPRCTTAWGRPRSAAALAQVDPVLVLAAPDMPGAGRCRGPRARPAAPGRRRLLALFADAGPVPVGASPARASDVAVALFTSGSTGVPKAALHTHRGLGYKAALMARGARARAAATPCSCPHRWPMCRVCSTACSSRPRPGSRRVLMDAVGPRRGPAPASRRSASRSWERPPCSSRRWPASSRFSAETGGQPPARSRPGARR